MTLATLIGRSRKYHNSHLDGASCKPHFCKYLLFFAWTACALYANLCEADALRMQIVRNWEKILQKSGLHEASPKWETKEYMYYGIFCFGWFYWLLKGLLFKATPRRRELWEPATKHHSRVQQTIENQEINHKNQANNENNHERTKERKDCENHNKPASEPRNHNKHNYGCFSVLRKQVLVCPCFLVWLLFLFLIFCIASLWLHLSAKPRNYHNNQNKRTKEAYM